MAGANDISAAAVFSAPAALNPMLLAANCLCEYVFTVRTNGPNRASWVEL